MMWRLFIAVFFGTLLGFSPLEVLARNWTTADGKTLAAEIVSYKGGILILKKDEGGKVLYSIKQLSMEDQVYVRAKFPDGDKKPTISRKPINPQPVKPKVAAPVRTTQLPKKNPIPARLLNYKPGDIAPNVGGLIHGTSDSITLAQLRGKLVLVDFWASWCPPCQKDMPQVVHIYNRYKNKGFEIIGVSLDKNYGDLKKFKDQYGMTWPMAQDKFKYISKKWGVETIPTMVLIDQNGVIISDRLYSRNLESYIRKHLGL
jgi:thiol-disulfide isomerase/thioredoxin